MDWFRKNKTASDNAPAPESSLKTETSSKKVTWADDLVTIYVYPWQSEETVTGVTIVGNKRNKKRKQSSSNFSIDIEYVYGTLIVFAILIFLAWYLSK